MNIKSLKNKAVLFVIVSTSLLVVGIFSFFALSPKEFMKVSLNNLVMGSSDRTTIIQSTLPSEYSLSPIDQPEPNLAGETKAVKYVEKITDEIFNKKDKTVADIQKDFFQPIDQKKLESDNMYILSDEFQDRITRGTNFWAPPCVARTHNAKLTTPIETQVSYSSENKYIVKVLLDNVQWTFTDPQWEDMNCSLPPTDLKKDDNWKVDLIYEYTVTRDTKTDAYMIYDLKMQAMQDLDAFRNQVSTVEKTEYNTGRRLTSTNNFAPAQAEGYNYSRVKNVDQSKVNGVFNVNGPKTVTITAIGLNGMGAASGYGFFVRSGVIATSSKVAEGLLKESISERYAVGFDGELHKITGVISASPELDIALIKLEDEFGDPVTLGDPTKLKAEDPVIVIGSPMGLSPVTRVGIFSQLIPDGIPTIRNSLPLGEGDIGSPLFNLSGEVVGLNTSPGDKKIDGDTSLARPSSLFSGLIDKLKKQNFKDIKFTNFSDLDKQINSQSPETTNSKVPESNNLWKKYKKLPDIMQYKSVGLLESYITGGFLSIRYKNIISDFISSYILIKAYGKKLEVNGFKSVYENGTRRTYTKGKQIVRIAQRYDYISVIYEEKQ
ncbi:MAG: serine protease [Candidatus Saccharibacteria bacterium]